MKKITKLIVLLIVTTFILTGCLKIDKMENINIITTIYPIEYITNKLYSSKSKITSIYPNGADIYNYSFTDKQIKDFSKKDLFIYNGSTNEKDYAKTMIKENKDLKIIDASYGIDTSVSTSDVWLNPANILMMAKNIKDELENYITSNYIINDIEQNYNNLKLDMTELEASFKTAADNSKNKTIVSYNEQLKFLEKYGFNVIVLTQNNENIEKNIATVKELKKKNQINYIFIPENLEDTDLLKDLKENNGFETAKYKTLETLSDKDKNDENNYVTIMKSNLDLIKTETYN